MEGESPDPDSDDDAGTTRFFAEVDRHIEESGFHLTYVYEDPPFCYSVGLDQSWDHPELLLYGLGFDDSATILIGLAGQIERGERFVHGLVDDETFYQSVAFIEIPKDELPGRFVVTIAIYDHLRFDALQVVTPDEHGRFPWHADCDPATIAAQPLLGQTPAALM